MTALSKEVEVLQSTLQGVTNQALTDALANVDDLCAQASALTSQVNLLGTALDDTVLGGVIPLGLSLLVPALPSPLAAFSCS